MVNDCPKLEEFLDNETGEKNCQELVRDAETGELEVEEVDGSRTFQVPVSFLKPQQECRKKSTVRRRTIQEFYFRRQEVKSNVVKELKVCTRKNVGPIVCILPTFLICPALASLLCLLGETYMHIWSHKRNRKKKNSNIEYRSPFHLISSQFCIHCRTQKWAEKIRQIQDKRTLRRRIIYPNHIRRLK